MEKQRYQAELKLLSGKFPSNAFRFFNMEDGATGERYLRIGAKTNSGNVYTLHMRLVDFPFKTNLVAASCAMHTLGSEHGWTRICHYGPQSWTPAVSLYKVYVKCRLWLEMYEAHLRTGNPIDYYLTHQI